MTVGCCKCHVNLDFNLHCALTTFIFILISVLVTGKGVSNEAEDKTYFFNTDYNKWTEGPPLQTNRIYHSCGKIKTNSQSNSFSVVVAGGYASSFGKLTSTEILDEGASEWRKGPGNTSST